MKITSTPPIALQSVQIKASTGPSITEQTAPLHEKILSKLNDAVIAADKAAAPATELPEVKVYRGEHSFSLLAPDAERDALFARLSESQQKVLLDNQISESPEFRALAEKLTDAELGQLVDTLDKLNTNPDFAGAGILGSMESRPSQFLKDLAQLDGDTLKQVIAKAGELADQVVSSPQTDLYDANGGLALNKGSRSANDLHNFVAAVHKADDVAQMMDTLASFDESLQSGLMGVMAADVELAGRVLEQLEGRDVAAAGQVLDYLAPLVEQQRFMPEAFKNGEIEAANERIKPDAVSVGYDNGYTGLAERIDGAMQLLENYSMDDAQLKDGFTQLSSLGETDQRAWLQITLTGLDTLVGQGTAAEPVNLTDRQEVLDTLDALRTNASVRDAVTMSGYGDASEDNPGLYGYKETAVSQRDREAMVDLLVTDAWLNQGDAERTSELASKLGQLGAEQRDQLVDQLNRLNKVDAPLANMSMGELQVQLEPLQNRVSSLLETDNIGALLIAEADTPEQQKEDFWAVTELAEEQVDKLVTELQYSDSDIRAQIIDSLAQQVRGIDSGEQSREAAQQKLNDMLDYFARDDTSADDKRSYLEAM